MDRRLDSFEHRTTLHCNWLTGIVAGTWATTMLAILFHH